MLYLIIHPETDYEMFSDGDIKNCIKSLERIIIEADSADDAITKYIVYNEGKVTLDNINNYFVLQVANTKCEVISDGLKKKYIKKIEDEQTSKELAELARLKNKYEGT